MHFAKLLPCFALLNTARASQDEFCPFISPLAHAGSKALILKRQSCPSNYNSCSSIGYNNACCPVNTNCALDAASHIACCPFNASCTGTAGSLIVSATSSTSPFVLGASTTTTASTAAFITPTSGVQGGGSTVPNAAFPFVYIPTSFANQALCSSYWTSCQSESASCFSSLAGAPQVTISGPGVTSLGTVGASSVCSALSATACYNLALTTCTQFPAGSGSTTTATATTNQFVQTTTARAGGLRATGCPERIYALGAGAVLGAAGVLM